MKSALLTKVDVTLSVPVTVQASDGKSAERSTITLRRPKVRHAKRLAVLFGSDLIETLLSGVEGKMDMESVEGRKLVTDVLRKLFDEDRLDGLVEIIADLAGEDASVIDDVDLIDLPDVAMAFAGFFPALQSSIAGLSKPSLPRSADTPQAT